MAAHSEDIQVVTGAFGYTGRYITRRLLTMGRRVRTLTGHPLRENPFGDRVRAFPFNFDNPAALVESLHGAAILYNTYWVRFPRGTATYERAVENTRVLLRAAVEAGVRRLVHISIASASVDSPFPYFRGKGLLEKAIERSRLSYAIVRPTVVFGAEDILINNIAWLLRRSPVFAIAGRGDYRLQPVYVDDVAEIAVAAGQQTGNTVLEAAGPELYTFEGLVRLIAQKVDSHARLVHLPPGLVLLLSGLLGYAVRDVVLTGEELHGLMSSLLVSGGPPAGRTPFSQWLEANAHLLGTRYASELKRHYRP